MVDFQLAYEGPVMIFTIEDVWEDEQGRKLAEPFKKLKITRESKDGCAQTIMWPLDMILNTIKRLAPEELEKVMSAN